MGIALQTVWLLMSGSVSAFAGMATWREQSDAARGPQGYAVSPQNAPTAVEMMVSVSHAIYMRALGR